MGKRRRGEGGRVKKAEREEEVERGERMSW